MNEGIRRDWLPVRDPVYAEKFALLRDRPGFLAPATADRPVRVLAVGSSRTQLGFDAARFEAKVGHPTVAFNFGCAAAGPLTCSLYVRRLLDAGAAPDYLFVELHPGFVTPLDPPFEATWLVPYRLRPDEVETLRGYGWAVPTPPHHGWRGWATAAATFRFPLLDHYAPPLLPCPNGLTAGDRHDARGFMAGIEPSPADVPKWVERTRRQYAPVLADYRVGGPGCAALRDLLGRCRAAGVRAAVVLMPEGSAFRAWYGAAGYEAVTRFTAALGGEHTAPVFDAREWVPDDGFSDGHHLTPPGAATFTDRLAAEAAGRWKDGLAP